MLMKKLLILVITHNGMRDIDKCLSSIDANASNIQGMVIDNSSTDSTIEHIQLHFPHIKVVETGKNLGFGAANNIGIRYAMDNNFDYVYLLNQDAWITPKEVERLLNIGEKQPDYAVISPLHVYEDNKGMDLGFSKCITYEMNNDCYLGKGKKELYEVKNHRIPAAHWLMRISALKTIGLFSPTFFHYAEDDNMTDRILYHGYKIGISPVVEGVHNRSERKITNRMYMYLMREQWVRILSNPNRSKFNAIKGVSVEFYKILVDKGLSTFPLLFNVICRYRKIIKNRKISMGTSAFINSLVPNL